MQVPIRDGEGHEAVIQRTLEALRIPGISFNNPTVAEEPANISNFRLFSSARAQTQMHVSHPFHISLPRPSFAYSIA
jgi:hypothetical protein